MSKETHEITDMDIEKSDDREQLPKSETKKESHYAVTNPTFLFPNMMFLHPPIQHPMYPPPELISPYPENFTNNTFQNIPPITNVIDYNHGFGQIVCFVA
ncbi:hypothetical protein RF11_11185 [Thelohanellus kitauei]|uniref:Uncharacterized protein n=1 Tax=Thelohanellus kitauei TaxID=669202 RepID=A0A0C2JDC4_THEKT|nr:hypothetical protein RF11_11185 [Thelohanellus kitauei]